MERVRKRSEKKYKQEAEVRSGVGERQNEREEILLHKAKN